MMTANLLALGQRRTKRSRRSRCRDAARKRLAFQPAIDPLERRDLLSTFDVVNLDDSGLGSLRQALLDANQNPGADTIRFARYVRGTLELSSQLVITDNVDIRGPGSNQLTISGGNASRVIAVLPADLAANPLVTPTAAQVASSPEVTIRKLAIANGLATDSPGFDPTNPANPGFAFGGGVYNLGGTVHLDQVHMADNRAQNVVTAGGAVANEFGGVLTVSRSSFEGNASTGFLIGVGGAITSDLGPTSDGLTDPPQVEIDRSSFVGNTAQSMAGYIDGVGFSGLGGGGAILNVTGAMRIRSSEFASNTAVGGMGNSGSTSGGPAFGGAILSGDASPFGVAESSLDVTSSIFVDNTATGGAGGVAGLPGGIAAGGAISLGNGTDAKLNRNTLRRNSAEGGIGGDDAAGGIATGGGVSAAGGAELSLERNKFIDNSAAGGAGTGSGPGASGRGGGLGLDSIELTGFAAGPATASIVGDTYQGNTAMGGIGGGIYNAGAMTIARASLADNRAVGVAEVAIAFVPGYAFQGAALGGGMSNLGSLVVDRTTFEDNLAVGADGAVGPNVLTLPPGTAAPTYPGLAVGGGLHNITVASVSRSRFVHNTALAGNQNQGSFAGVSNGGGIYNDGGLELLHSSLVSNSSLGGDGNVGDINAGGGYGGGITSGSVTALLGERSASLVVMRSDFRGNAAVGGNNNQALFPVPLAHAPSGGVGGGILAYQGTADISRSSVANNRAVGGTGGLGTGGLGAGGGIFFFGFVGVLDAKLSNSWIAHNAASGGPAGNGIGGGIGSGSLGSLFAAPLATTVSADIDRCLIAHNRALGGSESAGVSGDGLGGGIFNDSDGMLELLHSLVIANRAQPGGAGGEGIGGGIYNLGNAELVDSLIFANFAFSSDDDCFGCS